MTSTSDSQDLSATGRSHKAARAVLAHIWLGKAGYIIQEHAGTQQTAADVADYAALSGHVVTVVDPQGIQTWARTSSSVGHIISDASPQSSWTLDVADDEKPQVMIITDYAPIRNGSCLHLQEFDAAVTSHLTIHPNVDLFIVVLATDTAALFDPATFATTPRGHAEHLFPHHSPSSCV
jgi:hypothetical protein